MMRLIHYFIQNKSLNYVLLVFILFLGVNAYYNIPKELFPEISLDKVSIRGAYAGASADNLDKMAVRDIEDELGNIQGIDKIETVIKSGTFSIVLSLNEGADKTDALNKAKDAIARSRQYLPADMTEPTAELLTHNRPLIRLSLSSEEMNKGQLFSMMAVFMSVLFILLFSGLTHVSLNKQTEITSSEIIRFGFIAESLDYFVNTALDTSGYLFLNNIFLFLFFDLFLLGGLHDDLRHDVVIDENLVYVLVHHTEFRADFLIE